MCGRHGVACDWLCGCQNGSVGGMGSHVAGCVGARVGLGAAWGRMWLAVWVCGRHGVACGWLCGCQSGSVGGMGSHVAGCVGARVGLRAAYGRMWLAV